MTRARVKALHDKVNSLLSTLDLSSTLDGMLLHSDMLCILRYETQELLHGRMEDGRVEGREEGREEEAPGAAGTKPGTHTGICTGPPRSSRYHCRYGTGPGTGPPECSQ